MAEDKKTYRFKISDESLNTYGTWVLSEGIDLAAFRNNPVVLLGHRRMGDYENANNVNLPIGKAVKVELVNTDLFADIEFDMKDPVGAKVAGKVEGGFLSAVSIGFRVVEQSEDAIFVKTGQRNSTITKSQLVEISMVDIPANPNATNMSVVLYANDETGAYKAVDENGFLTLSDGSKKAFFNDLNTSQTMKKLAIYYDLPETATEEQVLAAAQARDAAGEAFKTQLAAQKVDFMLAAAKAEGKLSDTEIPHYRKLGLSDLATVEALLAEKTVTPAPPQKTATPPTTLVKALADANKGGESGANGAEYWASESTEFKYMLKNTPAALEAMKLSDPARYAEMKAAFDAHIKKGW